MLTRQAARRGVPAGQLLFALLRRWRGQAPAPAWAPPAADPPPLPVPARAAGHVLADAFTPTRPKQGRRQMVGRDGELGRILDAVQQDRAHVVLFSERGRGKTSLANLAVEELRGAGNLVARHTCEAGSTFNSIMRGLLRDVPSSMLAVPARPGAGEGCEAAVPDGPLRPQDIVGVSSRLTAAFLVCVIDEFDRVEDPDTRGRLADTMKQLSDRGSPVLFMIVGVSRNLTEIIGQHASIQRNLVAVPLSLLPDRQVAALILQGSREAGIEFPDPVLRVVVILSRGMPYMAQLLGLRIAQAALARGSHAATAADFLAAVARLAAEAEPRVPVLYAELTDGGTDAAMVSALRRVSAATQDGLGHLDAFAAADGTIGVGPDATSADCWNRLAMAGVVQSTANGTASRIVVGDRALTQYVLLKAVLDGIALDTKLPAVRDVAPGGPEAAPAR